MELENTTHTDDLHQETISQRKAADIIGIDESVLRKRIKAGKITKPPVYTEEWALDIKVQLEKEKAANTEADNTGLLFDDLPSGAPEEKAKEKAPVDSTGATAAFKQKEATGNYTPKPSQQRYSTELDKAHEALTFISPDLARDDWVRVGMALKNEFGDNGFSLFDEWSRGGKSYKANDTKDTWQSKRDGAGLVLALTVILQETFSRSIKSQKARTKAGNSKAM